MIAVTVYVPSSARSWAKAIWSPTARSPTAMVAPPLVIVVVLVTVMVRVQPSSVLEREVGAVDRGDRDVAEAEPAEAAEAHGRCRRSRAGPPWARSSPGAALVSGAVDEPGAAEAAGSAPVDGDGDAPIAATAPTTKRNAAPATIPTRAERVRPIGVWTFSRNSTSFGSVGWLERLVRVGHLDLRCGRGDA